MYYQPYTGSLFMQGSTALPLRRQAKNMRLHRSMEPFLCPHDDFLSISIRELALDFGDFPSSANVVKTPKRLADFKVLTIAEI